jgi:hypothetical protein
MPYFDCRRFYLFEYLVFNLLTSFLEGKQQIVYVFSAFVPEPYMTTNLLRTSPKVSQHITTHSTINFDGFYVVPATIVIGGLLLTPFKIGLLLATRRKFELVHFDFVAQWGLFEEM